MHTFRRVVLSIFFGLVAPLGSTRVFAGAHTRAPGSAYVQVAAQTFASNRYYTLDGDLRDRGATFRQTTVQAYAEVGVLEWLTAIAAVPVLRIQGFSDTESIAGVGDPLLEVKARLLDGPLAVAVNLGFEPPVGRSEAFADSRAIPGSSINLPTSDGELNIWTRATATWIVDVLQLHLTGAIAYNLRTEGFSDQIYAGFEAGRGLFDILWLRAGVETLRSLGAADASASFVFGEGSGQTAFTAGAFVRLAWGFAAVADFRHTLAHAHNVYAGATFGAGLAYEL
jgi:hypothetical protein